MSICDRLHKLAVRGCLIVGLFLVLTGANPDSEANKHPKEHDTAGESQTAAPPEVSPPVPPRPQLPSKPDASKSSAAIKQERCKDAEREQIVLDECQQWRMAKAAELQNRLTIWEIGFLVGALFVSIFGTGAAVYAVIITRKNAQIELRAYVSLSPGPIRFDGTTNTLLASIVQKNYGSTPAKDARLAVNIFIKKRPLPSNEALPSLEFDISRNVLPANVALETRVAIEDLPGEDLVAANLDILGDAVFVNCAIEYTDVFGTGHKTEACWSYILQQGDLDLAHSQGVLVPVEYTDRHNDAT